MSTAVAWMRPMMSGWWIITREWGKSRRLPFSFGAWRRIEPIEAAMPVTTTFTGEEIIRMVS